MPKPTRTELEHHIAEIAELFGWIHHRTHRPGVARDGYPDGFPSDALIRGRRLVFFALAPANGRLTRRERAWVKALGEALSIEVHVFRPHEARAVTAVLRTDVAPGPRGAAP